MKLLIAMTTVAVAASPVFAGNITCRKPNGQIAKASECAGKPAAVPMTAAEVPTVSNTKKDATGGRCRWTTKTDKHKAGQFVKCPA